MMMIALMPKLVTSRLGLRSKHFRYSKGLKVDFEHRKKRLAIIIFDKRRNKSPHRTYDDGKTDSNKNVQEHPISDTLSCDNETYTTIRCVTQ